MSKVVQNMMDQVEANRTTELARLKTAVPALQSAIESYKKTSV